MSNNLDFHPKRESFFTIFLAMSVLLLGSCSSTSNTNQNAPDYSYVALVESIKVESDQGKTVVEIRNSRPAPYKAYGLGNPPRFIVDIRGERGSSLPLVTQINDGNVREIRFENGKRQAMTVRMIADFAKSLEYHVTDMDNLITLTFTSK